MSRSRNVSVQWSNQEQGLSVLADRNGRGPDLQRQRCAYHSPHGRRWIEAKRIVHQCQHNVLPATAPRRLRDSRCELHFGGFEADTDTAVEKFLTLIRDCAVGTAQVAGIIDLTGLRWLADREAVIADNLLFGMGNQEFAKHGAKHVVLHDCYFRKGLRISDLDLPDCSLDLSSCHVEGDLVVTNSNLRWLNLTGISVTGDILLDHANTKCGIDLRHAVGERSLVMRGCGVEGPVSFSGAVVRREVTVEDVVVNVMTDLNAAASVVEDPRRSKIDGWQFDDPMDTSATCFGALEIRSSTFAAPVEFGRPEVARYVELTDVAFTGGISLDRQPGITDLELSNVTISLPEDAAGAKPRRLIEARRAIRSLRELARGSGDPAASSSLIREERALLESQFKINPLKKVVWNLHELVSENNQSWTLPILFMLGQMAFFAAVFVVASPSPAADADNAIALSMSNSFAPFVSLQVDALVDNMLRIILSIIQSAVAAGVISSFILALRENAAK